MSAIVRDIWKTTISNISVTSHERYVFDFLHGRSINRNNDNMPVSLHESRQAHSDVTNLCRM